jgi:hypothetical protein
VATQKERLDLIFTRIGNYLRDSVLPRLLPTGGTAGQVLAKTTANNYAVGWADPGASSGDGWTRIKLALDFALPNSAVFTNISDGTTTLTFTPPANADWELEGRIMIETATAANLPRVGVNIGAHAANGYGTVNIWQGGATVNAAGVGATGGWKNNAAAVNVQMAVGGLPAPNVPALAEIIMSGRSGNTPQPITIQLANETAAANMGKALRGSFIKWRSV